MHNNKIFKGIRFRDGMIIIYIIAGIIPFLLANIYTNSMNQSTMQKLSKESQIEELTLIRNQITESMKVVDNVSRQIFFNTTVQSVVGKTYDTIEEFERDCSKLKIIDDYLRYYKQDISSIIIYVDNKPVNTNKYFGFLGRNPISQDWYEQTCRLAGGAYWSWGFDKEMSEKHLQITRQMTDANGDMIGILCVQMQNENISDMLAERTVNTALLYGDDKVVKTNFQIDDNWNFMIKALKKSEGISASKMISNGIEEYLLTYDRTYQNNTNHSRAHFTLLSIQSSRQLAENINKNSLAGYAIVVVSIMISIFLIVVLSYWYGKRIEFLKKQMHYVAVGEYDKVTPITGSDEIGGLYKELELMKEDNSALMKRVVEEQVQKEKLHTKQKEVEFKMLASQINPHFLYNTLETIRMKAKVNKEPEIEELVKMLAKIMRRNIQVSEQMVTLKSEVELIEYYLKIQSYRFGDRIQYEIRVDDDIDMKAKVLPLIMQPFVENAYAHGLEQMDEGGKLDIIIERERETIKITIEDNGVGMDYYTLGKLRHALNNGENMDKTHIGINNVNQRLKLQYGSSYGVTVNSTLGAGTSIIITMPYYWGNL